MPRASDRRGELVVASYNVHRCIGADGLTIPERVAEVLRGLEADVVALQEVDSTLPEHGLDQLELLARALAAHAVPGPTLLHRRGTYGNALLVRRPVLAVRRHDLSVGTTEPRGALDVDLDLGDAVVRVVATHFGLGRRERHRQAAVLLALLGPSTGPTVLLGDFNEWLPRTGARRLFDRRFGPSAQPATYPAALPLFGLDRIWVDPASALLDVEVHRTALTRIASDHLPLRARLDLGALRPIAP